MRASRRSCARSRSFSIPRRGFRPTPAELDAELPHQLADFPAWRRWRNASPRWPAFDVTGRIHGLTAKTLVIVPTTTSSFPTPPASFLAGQLGWGVARSETRGGHACNVVRPEVFIRPVLAWLAGRDPEE
jgi:aminoacrylate hydrolase